MDVLSASLSKTQTGCSNGGIIINRQMFADDLLKPPVKVLNGLYWNGQLVWTPALGLYAAFQCTGETVFTGKKKR